MLTVLFVQVFAGLPATAEHTFGIHAQVWGVGFEQCVCLFAALLRHSCRDCLQDSTMARLTAGLLGSLPDSIVVTAQRPQREGRDQQTLRPCGTT